MLTKNLNLSPLQDTAGEPVLATKNTAHGNHYKRFFSVHGHHNKFASSIFTMVTKGAVSGSLRIMSHQLITVESNDSVMA
jgi:hypothetical protein